MTKLTDLFDAGELNRCLSERLVVQRRHTLFPLLIFNYTERCQYERGLWSPVTLACRGLIVNADTLEVVARPFRKFFNAGQEGAPTIGGADAVTVTDKLDGSLGVLYPTPDGLAIATRGSFDSDQARHATEVWRERYSGYVPRDGWTLLFEIIYPSNRIVLDYAGQDDLVLLGAVHIATGNSVGPHDSILDGWPGPRAAFFSCTSYSDALALPPRANAEGIVVHVLATDERVKIKQAEYVALHKIVTGLNERTVWDHLEAGKALADLLAPLPDEFHNWVREVAADLVAKVEADAAEVERAYSAILSTLPPDHTRKDFALEAVKHRHRSELFARRDGKDYRGALWKAHYPEALQGPRQHSEDTA